MSCTQEGSSGGSRKSKNPAWNRRSWTKAEETVLITAMKEIVAQGWRSENGFRVEYLKKLEVAMKIHFPDTDLKALPHICSKVTTWKKHYSSMCSILRRSGVGFNLRGNHKIDCEDDTCDQILNVDENAKSMRYKMWPYYEDWKEIYGEDRATREMAEDIPDAWNEMQDEENTHDAGIRDDYEVSTKDLAENEGTGDRVSNTEKTAQTMRNRKKRKTTDEVSGLCDLLAEFGRKTDERIAQLMDSIGYDASLGQACEDAFEQLGSIEGLTLEQRFDVCEILSANVDKVKIFKGLPDFAKAQYVEMLLKNKGK